MLRDQKQTVMVGVGLSLLWLVSSAVGLWAEMPRLAQRATPSPSVRMPRDSADAGSRRQAASASGITLKDGLLSVDLREQDLRTVIESIAAQGGIEVRYAESLPEKRLSLRFDDLPVVDGLKRLFRVAELTGYALVTKEQDGQPKVQRILFLPAQEDTNQSSLASRAPRRLPQPERRPPPETAPPPPSEENAPADNTAASPSVFDDIKNNTTARRLVSQLVHPNDQVRERALERLIQLIGDDDKQAELLEHLEPILEQLASENKEERDTARADIRKLLQR